MFIKYQLSHHPRCHPRRIPLDLLGHAYSRGRFFQYASHHLLVDPAEAADSV